MMLFVEPTPPNAEARNPPLADSKDCFYRSHVPVASSDPSSIQSGFSCRVACRIPPNTASGMISSTTTPTATQMKDFRLLHDRSFGVGSAAFRFADLLVFGKLVGFDDGEYGGGPGVDSCRKSSL